MSMVLSLTLIAGIGSCIKSGEWCHTPTGKIAIEQKLFENKRHSLVAAGAHYSRLGDGEFKRGKGDRGLEIISIDYRYEFDLF